MAVIPQYIAMFVWGTYNMGWAIYSLLMLNVNEQQLFVFQQYATDHKLFAKVSFETISSQSLTEAHSHKTLPIATQPLQILPKYF
jgi:hypothetical protein